MWAEAIDKTKIDFFNKNCRTLNDLKLFKQKTYFDFSLHRKFSVGKNSKENRIVD